MQRPTASPILPTLALLALASLAGGPGAPWAVAGDAPVAPLPPPAHRIVAPLAPAPAPRARPEAGARPRRLVPELGIEEEPPIEGSPTPPPLPPLFGPEAARRQRVAIRTDPQVGRLKVIPVDDTTVAAVLLGNPQITGDQLAVKARTMVVWLDKSKAQGIAAFAAAVPKSLAGTPEKDASAAKGAAGAAKGADAGAPAQAPGAGAGDIGSVIPEAVLGIYASGAVDLVTGDLAFRGAELFVDPRTNRALLIEPRFDGAQTIGVGTEDERDVPIHVRAERARILSKGLATFDQAAVTTSYATDRIELQVTTLTLEEYGAALAGESTFLGFRNPRLGTQRYVADGVRARGERLTLFYAPHVTFGGAKGIADFPVRLRDFTLGSRSSFGRYAFLGVGGALPDKDPWLDWTFTAGGYTKRGPAGLLDLKWTPPQDRGQVRGYYVYDSTGHDRNDYEAGEGGRGFVELENKWDFAPKWRLDLEANWFSDRDVNEEFFQTDARNHKDRETYVRPRYLSGGFASTLTAGDHLRDFQTETIQEPEVEAWSESLPLWRSARPGGPALDLSSEVHGGWLRRMFDSATGTPDYTAYRLVANERVYAPFLVGDVKVSPFVGAEVRGYYDRTDGGSDLTDGTLTAGVTADLQLHQDFAAYGGPWALDGLRHVIDIDLTADGRWLGSADPQDVPQFDRLDTDVDRTEVVLDVYQRLETRRAVGRVRRNSLVAGLRTRFSWWPEHVGPYGQDAVGSFEWWGGAEVTPATSWVVTEGLASVETTALRRASVGYVYAPTDDLSVAVGLRGVKDEVFAPWFDVYCKWNPKWAVRGSGIEDLGQGTSSSYRVSLLRFSDDHMFEVGMNVRDGGSDLGVFFNFSPAIGGIPTSPPFTPREDIETSP